MTEQSGQEHVSRGAKLRLGVTTLRERLRPESTTTSEYLANFGLTWRMLKGKRVLDIGAGMGHFANDAKKRGIEVVSFDKSPNEMGLASLPHLRGIPYVIGDALRLHEYFRSDPPFDLAVSRRAVKWIVMPPTGLEALGGIKDRFGQLFSEARQVLRPSGEFRFDGEDWTQALHGGDHVSDENGAQRSLEFLRSVNPHAAMGWGTARGEKVPFFVLKNE